MPMLQSQGSYFYLSGWLVGLVLLVIAFVGVLMPEVAYADVVIKGCTVVSAPSATRFTNCPNMDLSNANFGAVVNLDFANFSGSNLSGANLSDLDVNHANFSGATLTGADLNGDSLNYSNFANTNLTSANLSNADFSGGNLSGVIWNQTTCPDDSNSNNNGNTCIGHLLFPTITATGQVNGTPYTAGSWTKQNVTVRFVCAAAPGHRLAAGACPAEQSFSAEGVFTATGSVQDLDGFFNDVTFAPIQIDKTAPTIVASASKADGSLYVAGTWSNQNVTVRFQCSDNLAGLVAACPAEQMIGNEGVTAPINATTTDKAGNSANASFGPIQIDKSKPIISGNRTPAANSQGWNNSDVTVSFSCADTPNGSGLATNTVAGATLSSEGANQSATNSGDCIDNASNRADAVTIEAIHLDKSAPETTILSQPDDPGPSVASFVITGSDSLSGIVGFTCSLDGATFAACTSPQHYRNLAVGTHRFEVKASNAADLIDATAATFSWNVNNDLPVADDQAVTTPEESAIAITLTGSGKQSITYTLVSTPTHGVLSGLPPLLVYTPTLNFNGNDSFTFRVNEGQLNSNLATVTINVTPINDLPVINQAPLTIDEDTPISVTLGVVDVDGDELSYRILSGPTHGVLLGKLPNLTYTPMLNFNGNDGFTFSVDDGQAPAITGTVQISVTAVNDAPLALNQLLTTRPNSTLTLTLTASDAEESPLTYKILTQPQHGTLSGTAPTLLYTPAADFSGTDQLTFTASDGQLTSNPAIVTIGVTNYPYSLMLPVAKR